MDEQRKEVFRPFGVLAFRLADSLWRGILSFRAKVILLARYPSSSPRDAGVKASRAQQHPGRKPPLALSSVDDKDVRALHVQAGASARYARDPSRTGRVCTPYVKRPSESGKTPARRVARITASIPRIRPTRRGEGVASVLLTSFANFQSPRIPSSSPRTARFPSGR